MSKNETPARSSSSVRPLVATAIIAAAAAGVAGYAVGRSSGAGSPLELATSSR